MALNISFISNKLINALKCMFAVIEIILWGNNVLREGHNSSSLFLKKKKKKYCFLLHLILVGLVGDIYYLLLIFYASPVPAVNMY